MAFSYTMNFKSANYLQGVSSSNCPKFKEMCSFLLISYACPAFLNCVMPSSCNAMNFHQQSNMPTMITKTTVLLTPYLFDETKLMRFKVNEPSNSSWCASFVEAPRKSNQTVCTHPFLLGEEVEPPTKFSKRGDWQDLDI